MTALPHLTPNGAHRPNPSNHDAPQHGEAVLASRDVPIAVWRLDGRDNAELAAAAGAQIGSRLAQRLILVYTRRGDTVVDLDSDPPLEHASAHTSRTYLSVSDPSAVADKDALTAPVSLVVLRWPPRRSTWTPAGIADLFAACRLIMTADSCAIAAVSSAAPGEPGTTYAAHLDELLPAARGAGLTPVLHIVAVTGLRQGDEFLYYATADEAQAARQDGSARRHGPITHVDLVVFRNRGQE